MTWYYLDGERTVGPVSESELEGLIHNGTLSPDVQVWREGMADWQPYGTLKTTAVPAQAPGLRIARHDPAATSVPTQPINPRPEPVIESAPFGQRIVAKLIDLAIIAAWVAVIVGFFSWIATGIQRLGGSQNFQKSIVRPLLGMAATFFGLCLGWFMRHWRATHKPDPIKRSIGKRVMNIVVVDTAGRPLGRSARFSRAVIQLLMVGLTFFLVLAPLLLMAHRPPRPPVHTPGRPPTFEGRPSRARFIVPFFVALVLSQAGYAVALLNPERRGLHDLVCRTRVINTSP